MNRLDAPMEGILVLAKKKSAASDLSKQIKEKRTQKCYYALCYGTPDDDRGHLTDNLIRRADNGLAMAITDEEAASASDGTVTLLSGEKVEYISGDVKKAELEYEVTNY